LDEKEATPALSAQGNHLKNVIFYIFLGSVVESQPVSQTGTPAPQSNAGSQPGTPALSAKGNLIT
jgi:hypothetical protein